MSAPELPPELAGHLDVLTDKSDAHAKARAATAIASGNAHVAAAPAWNSSRSDFITQKSTSYFPVCA